MKDYKSTAEAARELGLSVGSVQKLVSIGELEAVRTQGGHRRIFNNSIEKFKLNHGYRSNTIAAEPGKVICIIHKGDDLDILPVVGHDPQLVRLMSHPFDLLGMEEKIHSIFLDAKNEWLKNITTTIIDELRSKYAVIVYNSANLPDNSYFHKTKNALLIPHEINMHFISGYLTREKVFR